MKDNSRILYTGTKPNQKVSYAEKSKKEFEWAKNCIDYYSRISNDLKLRDKNKELYNWYNNIIPEEAFQYITNPLNSSKDQYKNFPAKLKPFNIAKKIVDQLLGEYRGRPFNYQVSINNPDAHSRFLEAYDKTIEKEMFQIFFNLQNENAQTEEEKAKVESREVDLEKTENGFNNTYKDERSIQGQFALEYLVQSQEVFKKAAKQFKDFCITGEAYSYKNVVREEVIYERVNPLEIIHDSTVEHAEDGEFAVRTFFASPSELLDMFYDEMTEEDVANLDKDTASYANTYSIVYPASTRNVIRVQVVHATWKTFTKIKVKTWVDDYGMEQKLELPEEYVLTPEDELLGATLDSYWTTEVWEGYRVRNEKYYRIRPVPAQRNEMNNLSKCKLPYNSVKYSNDNAENISLLSLCIPYVTLYIIIMYMYEMTLAKNGGKVLLMHKGAIPNTGGWDVDKFMYYAKALGFMFIDDKQYGANPGFNQYTVLDMSTLQHCSELINMLDYIERQLQNFVGMSPQRLGSVANNDQVGTTERAVAQSATITEDLFQSFDNYIRRDLQGMLDCSKMAWINGKKSMFIGNDLRSILLSIDPANYVSSDFGINVSNNSEDNNILNQMKNIIQPLSQNGTSPNVLIKILKAKNVEKLQSILSEVEKKQEEMQMQQQQSETQAQQEMQTQQLNVQKELEQFRAQMNMQLEQLKINGQIQLEQMRIDASFGELNHNADLNKDGVIDQVEMEKLNLQRQQVQNDMYNKQADRSTNTQLEAAKLQMAKYKEDVGMAKEQLKAKTALKNKTSGEK